MLMTHHSLLDPAPTRTLPSTRNVKYLPLIWKNATRNPRRTALTLLSVAVSLMLLTLLLAVEDSMRQATGEAGRSLRLSVRHKTSFAITLPIAYRSRLEAVPGVVAVCPFAWYGGSYRDPREILPSVTCDPQTLQAVWGDRIEATDAEWASFKRDRMGAMVTQLQAERHGWKVGDTITLKGRAVPVDLTFHISGILTKTFDPLIFLLHWKYLDESMGNPGNVGNYWLKVDRPESLPRTMRAINAMYANSAYPVVAETEKSLVGMIMGMLGMFRLAIMLVGAAVVASMLLVTAATIAMSVRERIAEVGVLRAIGFGRLHIFAFLLSEAAVISGLGGLIGSTGAWVACRLLANVVPGGPVAALLSLTRPALIPVGFAISLLVGLAGALVPAVGAVRIPVSTAIRQVV